MTYAQMIVMARGSKQDSDSGADKPLPKRVWRDRRDKTLKALRQKASDGTG